MEVFKNLAQDVGICLANTEVVTNNAEDWKFDEIVISILQTKSVKVVACFCEGMTVRGILKAIRRLNATGEFLLVGSDGWSDRYDVVEGYEVEASGGISVRIHSPYVNEFDPYYFNLHPDNNTRNPWFKEFWEFKFNCSLTPKVVKDQAQAKTPLLPNQAPFPGTRLFNRSCS
ncbi:metabotropic glutamate receptor 1-like, partial [Tetranychus urticae]